jgi:MFS family permease
LKNKIYPWLVVAMLCVAGALNYLDRMMITTMRTSIVEAMPMTDAQFGLLTAVFLWIYGILSPVAGFMADRFNRSRVIIIGLFVWSVVTLLTGFATSYEHLLITRALMGISESCYAPAAVALIMDYHRGSTRSTANGLHIAGIMIGQSMGFIGGWMASDHSWNYPFQIFGVVGIVYAVFLFFGLKDSPEARLAKIERPNAGKVNFFEAVKDLMGRPAFLLALSVWSLLGIVGWMIVGWLPTFFKENFNLSQTMAGVYSTGYFHGASLAGVIAGGFIADRLTKKHPRGRILVPAFGLCIAAPAIYIASNSAVLALAVGCFMTYSFTRIFTDGNMMPILCLITDDRYRATAYGILNFFSCIIGGIGLYAGGVLRDANIGMGTIFQTCSVLLAVCAFLLYRIKPDTKLTN